MKFWTWVKAPPGGSIVGWKVTHYQHNARQETAHGTASLFIHWKGTQEGTLFSLLRRRSISRHGDIVQSPALLPATSMCYIYLKTLPLSCITDHNPAECTAVGHHPPDHLRLSLCIRRLVCLCHTRSLSACFLHPPRQTAQSLQPLLTLDRPLHKWSHSSHLTGSDKCAAPSPSPTRSSIRPHNLLYFHLFDAQCVEWEFLYGGRKVNSLPHAHTHTQ